MSGEGESYEDMAYRLGQQAMDKNDPQQKMILATEAISAFACHAVLEVPTPKACIMIGEIAESAARFFMRKPIAPYTLKDYINISSYFIVSACRSYAVAASYYPKMITDPVLQAREKLTKLMEDKHYFVSDSAGGPRPFSAEEIFAYRMTTANENYPLSQYLIAKAYVEGNGVKPSLSKALIWAERVAKVTQELPVQEASDFLDMFAMLKSWENGATKPYATPPLPSPVRGLMGSKFSLVKIKIISSECN